MKLLVDMNLSPDWIPWLQAAGWNAIHWSQHGLHNAPDPELLATIRERVCETIQQASRDLEAGALLNISAKHSRLRKLPINP